MLVIRQQQISSLVLDRAARFESRMVEHVAGAYPEDYSSLGPEEVLALVRRVLEFGAARRILGEAALESLLDLSVEYGERLELAPCRRWALRILSHPELPENLKLALVRQQLADLTQGRRIVRFQPTKR